MGWTQTTWNKGTKILEWYEGMCNHENDKIKQTILDAALVKRQRAYAALETLDKETGEKKVIALVSIVQWTRDYYNFGYKDMSEFSGPNGPHDCPERIMKLLTPIEKPENKNSGNQWARNWRAYTWKEIRRRKHHRRKGGQFKKGDTVVFRRPLEFTSGVSHKQLTVLSTKPLRFTDGSSNMFGHPTIYNIKRSTIDYMLEKIVPAGESYVPKFPMPDLSGDNIKKYPIFKMKDYDDKFRCIAWGVSLKIGWEWYAFEIVDIENGIYYGFVHGIEDEFGTFSVQELAENGIQLKLNPKDLHEIMPPVGWIKVEE